MTGTIRYVEEFRDKAWCADLLAQIGNALPAEPLTLMEVCGTHTMAVSRFGLRALLPPGLRLVSGPGCPVCVTPTRFIDRAVALSRLPGVTIATFGDLIRVPGSTSSLERERSFGARVEIVYSTLNALDLARREPRSRVVFLGVGFETTSPTVAAALLQAEKERIPNFYILADHKVMPPAMQTLLDADDVRLSGFLCPGHVSVVIGSDAYRPLSAAYRVPCVISGFEPVDILLSLLLLVRQAAEGRAEVENTYGRAVTPQGNPAAREFVARFFEPTEAEWRGLGVIPGSGLRLRQEYAHRDAARMFAIDVPASHDDPACRCPQVLRGVALPTECPLFGRPCTPTDPRGACMVSSEGTCAAYYRYERASTGRAATA